MLIYCDPPYQTTKYDPIKYRTDTKYYDIFDNEKFWNIMRLWSKKNHVFISETTAPDDFVLFGRKRHIVLLLNHLKLDLKMIVDLLQLKNCIFIKIIYLNINKNNEYYKFDKINLMFFIRYNSDIINLNIN